MIPPFVWRLLVALFVACSATSHAQECTPAKPVELAVGPSFNCARMDDATVRCWGGAHGWDGPDVGWFSPVVVADLQGATRIQVAGASVCGLLKDTRVRCWDITAGKLPLKSTMEGRHRINPQIAAESLGPVKTFWFDRGFFAQKEDGTVLEWRAAKAPALSPHDSHSWVPAPALKGAIRIVEGPRWGCALMPDKPASCWGTGPWPPSPRIPKNHMAREVASHLAGAIDVLSSDSGYLYALFSDRRIRYWNPYVRSQGKAAISEVMLPGSEGARLAAAWNKGLLCAIVDQGVKCWIDGKPDDRRRPGLLRVEQLGFGWEHGCALNASQEIRCWGESDVGQAGDGTMLRRASSRAVAWCPALPPQLPTARQQINPD